jgi:hypothetical protein
VNSAMMHVEGINGFPANAELIYRARSARRCYHNQMNTANFKKWIVEELIPSLTHLSAIDLDNAPYHCLQTDKPPLNYTRKL